MNKLQIAGVASIVLGYIGTGFFWFGPSFMAGKMGILDQIGPLLFPALMAVGLGLLVAGSLKRR
ncbi:hypothetical protein EON81_02105 [bacterium]|nr:MAG: hypothetical protein EON81_02105 [bacterium]